MKKVIGFAVCALLALALLQAAALAEIPCSYFDEHGDHNWQQGNVVLPTCTTDGYYELECQTCHIKKTEASEPAYGHDWVETGSKEDSTCTKEGWAEVECENCHEKSTITLALAPHKWVVKSETKPTCAQKGSVVEECSVCQATRTSETNMLPHIYGAWVVSRQATDHSQGERTRVCSVCGNKETEAFYPDGTLMRGGKRGEEVQALQQKLIALGFLHDVADGIFGKNTEQAVKQLQLAEGLKSDGIAWPQTISALNARYQRAVSAPTAQPQTPPAETPAPQGTNPEGVEPGAPVIRPNVSEADGCVYWADGIGFEYVTCCEEHAALIEKTLHALTIEDAASRRYVIRPTLNAWNAALEGEYADWAAFMPENTARIEAARDAFRAALEAQAQLVSGDDETMLRWRLFSTMFECTRLCQQLHEVYG